MIVHPKISILFVAGDADSRLRPLFSYLRSMPHMELAVVPKLPDDFSRYDVVATPDTAAQANNADELTKFVKAGGGWLGLVSLSENQLPKVFGVQPGPIGPATELRVIFQNRDHPTATRLPEAVYLNGCYQALQKEAEDTEIILYADWRYTHSPVLVARLVGDGRVACSTLQAYDDPTFQQILYRLLRRLSGNSERARTLGVGLLGYAQSVGPPHGLSVENTAGLALVAACDLIPERLKQAQQDFPDVKTHATAEALASAPEVDVVIISTPPNTHATLSLQMMAAGKNVVCEKPLALNQKEADSMVEMAENQKLHLGCHQNRRWDVDFLAIKQALADGSIGKVFYMETFVGGFWHPCGYWHSHDVISGGTAYDWGAHYLDWIVSLIPDRVTAVTGTRHKCVWHDVTNADQERIQIRFAGGQEAEFIHSDIAAARKPKWYLLGTEGAIVGHWRDVTEFEIDPVLFFHQRDIPATEMTPDLTLYRRHPSGQIISQKLAEPVRQHHQFHRNLADHLLTGEPIAAPLEHSVLVVRILEAAARSAAHGGTVEILDG